MTAERRWGAIGPAVLTVVAAAMAVKVFRFFAAPYAQQVGFDEGYEAAAVERLIDGQWLPYVDAVSHRGPFLYWIHGLFQLATGRFEWSGTRALASSSAAVTILGTFAFGWAARWPLAGAIGGVTYFYVMTVLYDVGPGFGLHGEPVAIAVTMLACAAAAMGSIRASTRRGRIAWLAAAGALIAIATLTKQTLGIMVVPIAGFVALNELGKPGWTMRRVLLEGVAPFAAGGLALTALVLLRYALAGELGSFFFWSTGFNSRIYMEPYEGRVATMMRDWFYAQPFAAIGVAFALAVLVGRPLARWRARGDDGLAQALQRTSFEWLVAASALALLFAAVYPLRLWAHYFIPVWPFFGLLLGLLLEQTVRRDDAVPAVSGLVIAVVVGGLVMVVGNHRFDALTDARDKQHWYISPRPNPACAEIDRLGGAGREPVFMWGTLGDLYISCRRPSSSYFTYTTVVAGIVPPFWNEPKPSRSAPGSTEKLLAELTARPPPVILDAPMGPTTMAGTPAFGSFLNERYCRASTVRDLGGRDITFFARKDLAACQPPSGSAGR